MNAGLANGSNRAFTAAVPQQVIIQDINRRGKINRDPSHFSSFQNVSIPIDRVYLASRIASRIIIAKLISIKIEACGYSQLTGAISEDFIISIIEGPIG